MSDHTNFIDMLWRNSLVGKFVTLAVVVAFMILSASAFFNYQTQKKTTLTNIISQSEMLGSFIVSITPEAILSYDFDALNKYMEEINKGEDIVYAIILTPEGEPLTSYVDRRDTFIAEKMRNTKSLKLEKLVEELNTNKRIIQQSFPIFYQNNLLGNFKVGISKVRMEKDLKDKLVNQIILSLILTVLLAIGIFIVFRYYTMRPINQLILGAQRISGGTLDKNVEIKSNDELGHLGMVFNQMMDKLRNSIEDKDEALITVKELNLYLEERVNDRTKELKGVNEQLEKLAMNDSLTGLPNRFCIQNRLNNLFIEAKRDNSIFTVVMMDLDRFKDINDTLGHDCGDQLLIEVGLRLKEILRPSDFLGRLGGDEFAILLCDTDENNAMTVAKKIQTSLEPSFYLSEMAFSIAASIGIATYPQHGNTTSTLLKSADVAMYYAKQNKLDFYIYNPGADRNTPDRLSLMGELRQAIHENQLELFYQPEVDIASSRIIGVEALVRWNHPERGFVPPDDFIPMAEHSGLIRPLTYWVINSAIRQREKWHDMGIDILISINLSMHNLNDTDFAPQLEMLLQNTIVPVQYFEFEVTESSIMDNPDHVVEVMDKLNALNVSFAVDDFGTGYSSLSLLKKLPVQKLKIDKSFIMDMETDSDDEAIVHSVIDMAHILGLKVIAEGVENEKVLKLLASLGCDLVQGYHISRPLPAKLITPLLAHGSWDAGDTPSGSVHNLR